MTRISILHPSRSRPYQALDCIVHWLQNIGDGVEWEYILSIDSNDPFLSEYEALGIENSPSMRVIVNDNQNIVQASNEAGKVSTEDIIILVSDDFLCFKDWGHTIIQAMSGKSGVLKTYDTIQRWIVTLPLLSRDYYEDQGYIYYPGYSHMFCDCDMTHKADIENKLIIRNDIVFKHNHYSTKGGQPKDEVNKKADGTWAQGEKVYLQRVKEWRAAGLNIYDLSPEATKAGHVNWLKKKLR